MSKTADNTASLTNSRGFTKNRNSEMGRIAAAARPATSSDSRKQIRSRCRPVNLRKISTAAPYPSAGQPLPASRAARNSANASHTGSAVLRIKIVRRPMACQCHFGCSAGTNGCGHGPSSLRYPRKMPFADWLASVAMTQSQRLLTQKEGIRIAQAMQVPEQTACAIFTERHRRSGKEAHRCMRRSRGEGTGLTPASARFPAGLPRQDPPTFRQRSTLPHIVCLATSGALSIPARDDTPRLDG